MAETPLQEQVALVTGASQGIGRAIAHRLAALGATVVLTARSRSRLQEVAAEIVREGGCAEVLPADVRSRAEVEALAGAVLERYRRVDFLVNNAGMGQFGQPLHLTPPEVWTATLDTNLSSVYYAVRALAPHFIQRRTGHIINIASLAGHNPLPGGAVYAASKAALHGLSVSLAEELRAYNVRVSLVCPGSVDTELSSELVGNKDRSKMLRPEDVAHVVGMLATQGPRSFVSEVLIRPTLKP
ncbi:MAG TPA: SDR family oxidoreductase [Terriglobales bacterium]|nr:SDR family oxidoreductase [Terriglobales bacterium]